MREFVYLSHSKVAQFAPRHKSFWERIRGRRLSAGPATVSLQMNPVASSDVPVGSFEDVLKHLEEIAAWYEDDTVTVAGSWVFFDARMHTRVLAVAEDTKAVIFMDVPTTLSRVHRRRRLILHGNALHLSLRTRDAERRPREEKATEVIGGFEIVNPSAGIGWPTFFRLAGALGFEAESSPELPGAVRLAPDDLFGEPLMWLLNRYASWKIVQASSEWLAGCARITAIHENDDGTDVLFASPLYVERVAPPGEEIF